MPPCRRLPGQRLDEASAWREPSSNGDVLHVDGIIAALRTDKHVSLIGVQAAVAGGLGVTIIGKSFMQPGMEILQPPAGWPPLPKTEIVVLGEDGKCADLLQILVIFLTESLAGG